jgi:hypothetical protein
MAATKTEVEVSRLCHLAFEDEHYSRFKEAFDHHGDAITALNRLADDAKFLDRERKRVARKQAKFHGTRRAILQQIVSGHKTRLEVVLPSSISARESLTIPTVGLPCLSYDELVLARTLQPLYNKMQSAAQQGTFLNSKQVIQSFLASSEKEHAFVLPETQHMFTLETDDTRSISLYTPALDKTQSDIHFHVYVSCEHIFTSGLWYCFKVKDASERQTLYILQGLKRRRYQITSTSLSRATEFTSPCVQTLVTPVKSTGRTSDNDIGRQLTHITSSPLPVVDKPDRTKHIKWEPRRMSWGGRNFVWKQGKGLLDTELCEVKREWPQPGSKTGKMLDECLEPIVYTRGKFAMKKALVVTFRYGCGTDFLFRELVLASLLTRELVIRFGHSD